MPAFVTHQVLDGWPRMLDSRFVTDGTKRLPLSEIGCRLEVRGSPAPRSSSA
jgi:hypothetical protein